MLYFPSQMALNYFTVNDAVLMKFLIGEYIMITIPKDAVVSTLKSLSSKQLKVVERAIHRSLVKKESIATCLEREQFSVGDKVTFIDLKGSIKVGTLRKMNPLYARVWVPKDERVYRTLPTNLKIIERKPKETIN